MSIFKALRIVPRARTARDKALENPPRNCRFGRDIGIPVLMNYVMVLAYAVVSPVILPFGLLYFVFLWAVWRYQMLCVGVGAAGVPAGGCGGAGMELSCYCLGLRGGPPALAVRPC